jgi:PKD repeat protein
VYLATASSAATPGDYQGPSSAGAGSVSHYAPTGQKPESKDWFAYGYWWADLWSASGGHHIFQLDRTKNAWVDTGVSIDPRPNTSADALFDGQHLFIASHVYTDSSGGQSGNPAWLYRYAFDGTKWSADMEPAQINNMSSETLTIAEEDSGSHRIYATWAQSKAVYVNATTGDARTGAVSFGATPLALHLLPQPVPNSDGLTADDICAVVSYPSHIMVTWSDQTPDASGETGFYYAIHDNSEAASGNWGDSGAAAAGPLEADDHINLKAAGGLVFAAVKTSRDDPGNTSSTRTSDPLLQLLVFTPSGDTGGWTPYTVTTVGDHGTRPIVEVDPSAGVVHVFATTSDSGGSIFEKTAPLSDLSSFSAADTVIADPQSSDMNNASGTKQTVDSSTGMVVLASNTSTQRYWYFDDGQGPQTPVTVAPTASFTAAPTSGPAPLTVQFTDTSTGSPTSWAWDFGDGATSDAQNPSHEFAAGGPYSVTLTVGNAAGSSTSVPTTITVTSPTGGGGGGSGGGGGGTGGAGEPVTVAGGAVERIAGADRYATAVAVSRAQFPDGNAGAVVLARGDDYADALVGAPLAKAKNAPLLLTTGASLPAGVETELHRVLPTGGTVYLLGGTAAVPASVAGEITGLGYQVVRYGGADRFATAVVVAGALGDPSTVLLATGTNFPDALAAGPAAAHVGGAVLLSNGSQLPAATSAYLAAHSGPVYAIGGPASLAVPTATAVFGADRYATAADVAAKFFASPARVGIATGVSFPDALSGGALLAGADAPLVLATTTALPSATSSYLVGVTAATAYLFGGTSVLAPSVSSAVENALGT